jgi:coenzyme Q-binding protein COQ10
MPQVIGERILNHSREKVFACAIGIETYPQFLSYIQSVDILSRTEDCIAARFHIGIGKLTFSYQCEIHMEAHELTRVTTDEDIFSTFKAACRYEELEDGRCKIIYALDCKFASRTLEMLARAVLPFNTKVTINAFEKRLNQMDL